MFQRQLISAVRGMVRRCSNDSYNPGNIRRSTRESDKRPSERSINKVTLIGRLGRDIEVREAADGRSYIKMLVITNHTWKTSDDTFKSIADFHSVFKFGGSPEYNNQLSNIFKSGDKVYVDGRLSYLPTEDSKIAYIRADEVQQLARSYRRQLSEDMPKTRDDEAFES